MSFVVLYMEYTPGLRYVKAMEGASAVICEQEWKFSIATRVEQVHAYPI